MGQGPRPPVISAHRDQRPGPRSPDRQALATPLPTTRERRRLGASAFIENRGASRVCNRPDNSGGTRCYLPDRVGGSARRDSGWRRWPRGGPRGRLPATGGAGRVPVPVGDRGRSERGLTLQAVAIAQVLLPTPRTTSRTLHEWRSCRSPDTGEKSCRRRAASPILTTRLLSG